MCFLLDQCHDPTELKRACQLICDNTQQRWNDDEGAKYRLDDAWPFTDYLIGQVMCAACSLNDRDLCGEALSSVMMQLPQPATVKMIQHFGFAQLKDG